MTTEQATDADDTAILVALAIAGDGLDPDAVAGVDIDDAQDDEHEEELERAEDEEDRASAADALEEYRRDGGTSAAAFFEHLAAEARAEYGAGD